MKNYTKLYCVEVRTQDSYSLPNHKVKSYNPVCLGYYFDEDEMEEKND